MMPRNSRLFHRLCFLILTCLLGYVSADVKRDVKPVHDKTPKGVHLSLGPRPLEMVVVWGSHFNMSNQIEIPMDNTKHKFVYTAEYVFDQYIAGEPHFWNKAVISGLKPKVLRNYIPKNGNTDTGHVKGFFSLRAWYPNASDFRKWQPTFLLQNSLYKKAPLKSGTIQGEISEGNYHGVFDIGTNLCGTTMYHLMWNTTDMAAYIPYFTTPGMEGIEDDFYEYRRCFAMPGKKWPMEDLWYSFDVPGFAHVISFSTEVLLYGQGTGELDRMLDWMRADLDVANSARNRQEQPWIIALANRPFYCSQPGCSQASKKVRKHLEDVIYRGGVDLVLQSLEGTVYERTWPVYKTGVTDSSYEHPYAPVYVNSGAYRCNARANTGTLTLLSTDDHKWSAKRVDLSTVATYGRLIMVNRTMLTYEEWTADDQAVLVDQFNITQFHHGPFGPKIGHQNDTIIIVVVVFLVLITGLVLILFRKKIRKLLDKRNEHNQQVQYAQMDPNQVAVHA